jgi:azurin
MEKMKLNYLMALTISSGLIVASCNNNGTSSTASKTDTTKKMVDTTKSAAPAAGKVVSGSTVEIHAVGNNMSEMHYDVSEIDAPANTTMKVTLIDDATDPSMQHNFVVVKPGDVDSVGIHGAMAGLAKGFIPDDKSVIAASKLTKPGEKTTLEFKTPEPGEYRFICTYPGHYTKMQGKLIVK